MGNEKRYNAPWPQWTSYLWAACSAGKRKFDKIRFGTTLEWFYHQGLLCSKYGPLVLGTKEDAFEKHPCANQNDGKQRARDHKMKPKKL